MRNKLITLMISLILGFSSSIVSYAYFINKVQATTDLEITTGTFGVEVDEGINTTLMPGESSEYKNFEILNKGSLNQNIKINFNKLNQDTDELCRDIIYVLQLKNTDGEYYTVIESDLDTLENTVLDYRINSNSSISFRSKVIILENKDINESKNINLRINITANQINQ